MCTFAPSEVHAMNAVVNGAVIKGWVQTQTPIRAFNQVHLVAEQ